MNARSVTLLLLVLSMLGSSLALAGCGAESTSENENDRTVEPAEQPATKPAAADGTKVAPDSKDCTKDGETPAAKLQVTNNTSKAVDLYWHDYDCKPVHYATIKPGGSSTQNTFVDHVWSATSGSPEPVSSHTVVGASDTWDIRQR